MHQRRIQSAFIVATVVLLSIRTGTAGAQSSSPVDFNRDIRPILSEHCFACHGPDAAQRKGELRLDVEKEAKKLVISPGDLSDSELWARINHKDPKERMPPDEAHKPLSAEQIALVGRWIEEGAVWAQHWAWVAPQRPASPEVADASWLRNGIDSFVLDGITKAGLTPSPEADKTALIRRVSLNLIGLPPTPAEIDAFLADTSPEAYEKVIDRLLASPQYGERMAVDWLDGARYADSNGFQNDFERNMWPWRDWVIKAFNDNMPFDQFSVEQIAGDLLPNATDSQRIATGFNRNNRSNTEGGSIEEEWYLENRVDRVETTSAVFLGLTMGCARCHDHKYDPIEQKDFYRFLGFFNSTEDRGFYEEQRGNSGPIVSLPTPENLKRIAELEAAVTEAKADLDAQKALSSDPYDGTLKQIRKDKPEKVKAKPAIDVESKRDLQILNTPESKPAAVWIDGPVGEALVLDASAAYSIAPKDPSRLSRDVPFTMTTWVRAEKPGALFSQLLGEGDATRGVDAYVTEDGRIVVRLLDAPDSKITVTSEPRLKLNKWAHVAVVYNGSGKSGGLKIYVSGFAAPAKAEGEKINADFAVDAPLLIGRRPAGDALQGQVGDFTLYDKELSAEQINALKDRALRKAALSKDMERKTALREYIDFQYGLAVTEKESAASARQKERIDYTYKQVPSVMVMKELPEPKPTYRLVRGQYDQPDTTEALQPDVPAFLPPLPADAPRNRLTLAKWLVDPANPLTARVAVNRLWQKFFGAGLVKTLDNFGMQSEPPANQALLDWLAAEFVANKWDLKAMQKVIVMSATYRQDSAVSPELLERDPENRLLARGPRFRMPAEIVRDNALAVSGLLAEKIGGPSVMPYQPDGLWDELAGGAGQGPYKLASGEDLYRRSLYTYRKRTVPHPLTSTFDAPSFEICRAMRARTNTPLQALALLNDVTYVEAARNLAERMMREANSQDASPLRYGFRLVTGRYPAPDEEQLLQAGLEKFTATYQSDAEAAKALVANGQSPVPTDLDASTLAAYTALASVMLNLDETITLE